MQSSLIVLFFGCIILSIQGFYFGFIRPPRTLAWLQQSTFIISSFILIPFLLYVLSHQVEDKSRLETVGFKPHPSIVESVGLTGASTWVFEIDANEAQVREFYRDSANTGDWQLVTDTSVMMIFKKEDKRMAIGFREGRGSNTISYLLSEGK